MLVPSTTMPVAKLTLARLENLLLKVNEPFREAQHA